MYCRVGLAWILHPKMSRTLYLDKTEIMNSLSLPAGNSVYQSISNWQWSFGEIHRWIKSKDCIVVSVLHEYCTLWCQELFILTRLNNELFIITSRQLSLSKHFQLTRKSQQFNITWLVKVMVATDFLWVLAILKSFELNLIYTLIFLKRYWILVTSGSKVMFWIVYKKILANAGWGN